MEKSVKVAFFMWLDDTVFRSLFYLILLIATNVLIAQPSILFITHRFPSVTETFVLGQIAGLMDAGYEVSILACKKNKKNKFLHDIVMKYNLLEKVTFMDFYNPKNHEPLLKYIKKFDILYCQYDRIGKKFASLKQKYGYVSRLVVCVRGGSISNRIKHDSYGYQNLFTMAEMFLPVCNFFAKKLLEGGCPAEKIIVHHSAVDCDIFKFTTRQQNCNTITLLSIARLIPHKGLRCSIDAVAKVVNEGFDIKYFIIGEGWLYTNLLQYIAAIGMSKNIFLLGWQSRDAIKRYLYQADIFLHTARGGDGIPNVIMEAFATGLPVIGSECCGIQEIIQHDISGALVRKNNIHEIADWIEDLINNPEKRLYFGCNGRAYVEKEHNIEIENRKLIEIFKRL